MFLYGTSSHFWQFACAEIITALGVTFASGAFEAWLVDTLKHEGNTTPLQKVFGRNEYWRQGSVLLGSLTGSLIAEYDMRVPWMIGGVGELLVAFFAARYMREVYFQKKSFALISGYKEMLRTANTSVRYGLQSPVIRYIMIVAALQTFVFMAPNMQWQIWFGESVPIKGWLGYVMAANMLFMMIGSRLAVKLLAKQRNEEWAIMINQAAMGVLLVCTVVIGNLWGLVPFLAHQVFRGFWNPLKEAYLHDHIESRDRATIVSFESVMYHMAGAAGLVVSGFLGKQYGILTTWILVGGFLSIGTVGVYWLRKK